MSYNGWTNRETWCVVNHLDSDFVASIAYDAMESCADRGGDKTQILVAGTEAVVGVLRELYGAPDETSGLHADLLEAALASINWAEIGDSFAQDEVDAIIKRQQHEAEVES